MDQNPLSYSQSAGQLGTLLKQQCVTEEERRQVKQQVQQSYNGWAQRIYEKAFMNWGLWDKEIYREYRALDFQFSTLCKVQDVYSQLLLYYLIQPLVKFDFFDKRLLDVGCGNGIGLKLGTELLKTKYALGLDLVHKLTTNAIHHFYEEDKLNFLQADAENLPLENESFDIVTNIESSHLYPEINYFFSEVERVLSPGGFFCYADIHIQDKQQCAQLEAFVKTKKNLKIIRKCNITKMVQASIYQRLIVNEDVFLQKADVLFGPDKQKRAMELPALANAMGVGFLPWWKIWFQDPELRPIGKWARKDRYWGKKYFFYYLIQKLKP